MFIYFMKGLLRIIERKFTVSNIPILIFIFVTKEVVSVFSHPARFEKLQITTIHDS